MIARIGRGLCLPRDSRHHSQPRPGHRPFYPKASRGAIALIVSLGIATGCSLTTTLRTLGPGIHPGVFYVETRECALALTIDDAPSPDGETTRDILELLAKHGAGATLFVTANRINEASRPILLKALADGFELGHHGYQEETPARKLPSSEFRANFLKTEQALFEVLEAADLSPLDLTWYRAGGGFTNRAMRRFLEAHAHPYQIAMADVLPFDTETADTRKVARRVLKSVRAGSIVVLHDGDRDEVLFHQANNRYERTRGERTVHVLSMVLPALNDAGWRVTSLSGLQDLGAGKHENRAASCQQPKLDEP